MGWWFAGIDVRKAYGCALVALPLVLNLASIASVEAHATSSSGVVVDSVDAGFPADKAGLTAGDEIFRIRSKSAPDEEGLSVRDPFDVLEAEYLFSWKGPVVVDFRRNGNVHRTQMIAGEWRLHTKPLLTSSDPIELNLNVLSIKKEDLPGFCDNTEQLASKLDKDGEFRKGAWVRWRCAELAGEVRDWQRSDGSIEHAVLALNMAPNIAGAVWLARGRQSLRLREFAHAKRAVESVGKLAGLDFPLAVQSRTLRAELAWFDSQYAGVIADTDVLLRECGKRCSGNLLEAAIQNVRGLAFRKENLFGDAERSYKRAIEIRSGMIPGALETAEVRGNYAMLLRALGESAAALAEQRTAVKTAKRLAPRSLRLSWLLNNLALIHWSRGDFLEADTTLHEALSIQEQQVPDSFDIAVSMQNMATFAVEKGDFLSAKELAEKSLLLFQRVAAPSNEGLGVAYNQHGDILGMLGKFDSAEAEYRRAIDFWERVAPGSDRHAYTIHNLGRIAEMRGDKLTAKKYFKAAVDVRARSQPESQFEAHDLVSLGSAEKDLDELSPAREHLQRAIDIYARSAPQSGDYARALHAFGQLLQKEGKSVQATSLLCQAEHILDLQRQRVSASHESQAQYAAKFAEIPRDCSEAQIKAGDVKSAFEVIEASRARALREHMLFRDEVSASALPAALKSRRGDLYESRAQLEGDLAGARPEERESVERKLVTLMREEQAWLGDVRSRAPRYAALLEARKTDLSRIQTSLPRGTAALSYLLGEHGTYAFVLSGKDHQLDVIKIDVSQTDIERIALDLRTRILRREPMSTFEAVLRRDYDLLIRPVEKLLASDTRLLIVPDKGMQLVPFAALQDAAGQFVADRWSIAVSPSVSSAIESSRDRDDSVHGQLLAVGVAAPHSLLIDAVLGELPVLPNAEREANLVAEAYGRSHARVVLGKEATESIIRASAETATILHVAAHAYFDSQRPIETALLLNPDASSIESGDDGVVHAWEVMAHWHLKRASLVVLSACDTAAGKELANEGLVGLARAFQFAGAETVVATLWPIADEPTSSLMKDMYERIVVNDYVTDALRQAQRLARAGQRSSSSVVVRGAGALADSSHSAESTDLGHPYYWAGFEVLGTLP